MKEHEDMFSELPEKTNIIANDQRCSSNQPVQVKRYPLLFAVHEDIEKGTAEMVSLGVVESSTSANSSPLVLVKKSRRLKPTTWITDD